MFDPNILINLELLEQEEAEVQAKLEKEIEEEREKRKEKIQQNNITWRNSHQLEARRKQNKRYREKKKRILSDLSVETGLDLSLEDKRIRRIKVFAIKLPKT